MPSPITRHPEGKRQEVLDWLAAHGGDVGAASAASGVPERTVREWARSVSKARAKARLAAPVAKANPLAADIRAAAGRALGKAIARLDDPAAGAGAGRARGGVARTRRGGRARRPAGR